MTKRAGEGEVVNKNTFLVLKKMESEKTTFDAVMDLPREIFDEDKIQDEIPTSAYTDKLGHSEDISEELALQLIGENQRKPNCFYKLVSTAHHTCVTQYDRSKDTTDPDYITEYELEEYRDGYKPGIDEGSVSSGFWQAADAPKQINTTAILVLIMLLLFIIGVAGIAFVLNM